MKLLEGEKSLSRRRQIVQNMKLHEDFKADVQRFRDRAEKRRGRKR